MRARGNLTILLGSGCARNDVLEIYHQDVKGSRSGKRDEYVGRLVGASRIEGGLYRESFERFGRIGLPSLDRSSKHDRNSLFLLAFSHASVTSSKKLSGSSIAPANVLYFAYRLVIKPLAQEQTFRRPTSIQGRSQVLAHWVPYSL